MPIKPKKTSSRKRKTTVKRKKTKSTLKKNIIIFFSVLSVILLVVFGYILGQKPEPKETKKDTILKDLSKLKVKEPLKKKEVTKRLPTKKIKENKPTNKEKETIAQNVEKDTVNTKVLLAYRGKKPKLAIVIDDVHSKKQLQMIYALHMKLTPSIFPPFDLSKKSHTLAKNLKNYMIHLPMESANKKFNRQSKTLMTSFSDEDIINRVIELRMLFPTGKYVNNHTGSVFTSDYKMMKKLYIALKMQGFVFIDSFTLASSKVKKITHELGDAYVRRDVFIDNIHTVKAIHKELKRAVDKAKKNGYAIAIGHPHKITMKALKSAKTIIKDVELVYIDELFRRK